MPQARSLAPALRPADLPRGRPTAIAIAPDAAARAALAADLGIEAVTSLRLKGELRPTGRADWELEARLEAEVVQPCVVSLAPVRSRIDAPVRRRFLAAMPTPPAGETEMPEDDSAEQLGPVIDLQAVLAEALALALPDYPRAAGATPPGPQRGEPGGDGRPKPFAGLAALRGRLGGD